MQPVDNIQKYDRQLRLWHAHGQIAVENSKICLINADATGTETLKNLILPGVGFVTIIDNKLVKESDLGSNFFVNEEQLGLNKAESTLLLLKELNENVTIVFNDNDPLQIIQNEVIYFNQFDLVICSNLDAESILTLSKSLYQNDVALICVRSYGLIGTLRVALKEHTIIETHPDQNYDLRIDVPFESLAKFAFSFNIEDMEPNQKKNVPYIVILIQCIHQWKLFHKNTTPNTQMQKNAFKDMISNMKGKDLLDSENFTEAIASAYRSWTPSSIPPHVLTILDKASKMQINKNTRHFWVITKAISQFVTQYGMLPLSGSIPDMKSDTTTYIQLQSIYHDKAVEDLRLVTELVVAINQQIPLDEIARYCRFAQHMKVMNYTCVDNDVEKLNGLNIESSDSCMLLCVLMCGVDAFFNQYKRRPGEFNEDIESDVVLLKMTLSGMVKAGIVKAKSVAAISDDHYYEVVRSSGSELHFMAAFMGGIASQEAIKLLTHQYVPLYQNFVYDAYKSITASF